MTLAAMVEDSGMIVLQLISIKFVISIFSDKQFENVFQDTVTHES